MANLDESRKYSNQNAVAESWEYQLIHWSGEADTSTFCQTETNRWNLRQLNVKVFTHS